MENSIYVDRRLFPEVNEVTMLDARPYMETRLRDGEGPHNLRMDLYSVAYDGESVFGTDRSHLIGRSLPPAHGLTLLRQRLGNHGSAFTHIILDPAHPDVVVLIGPSQVPQFHSEEFKLIPLKELLEREALTSVTRMALATIEYANTFDVYKVGSHIMPLPLDWELERVTTVGAEPAFYLRHSGPATTV